MEFYTLCSVFMVGCAINAHSFIDSKYSGVSCITEESLNHLATTATLAGL